LLQSICIHHFCLKNVANLTAREKKKKNIPTLNSQNSNLAEKKIFNHFEIKMLSLENNNFKK